MPITIIDDFGTVRYAGTSWETVRTWSATKESEARDADAFRSREMAKAGFPEYTVSLQVSDETLNLEGAA